MAARAAHSEINLRVDFDIKAETRINNSDILRTECHNTSSFLSGTLASGVDAKQTNRAYVLEGLVITSGTSASFLFNGILTRDVGYGSGFDSLGQSMDFEEIVCLIVKQTAGPGRCEFVKQSYTVDWIASDIATVANGGALKPGSVRMWYQDDIDALDMNTTRAGIELRANGGDVTVSVYAMGRHDDDESSSSSASTSSSSSLSTSSVSSSSSSSTST